MYHRRFTGLNKFSQNPIGPMILTIWFGQERQLHQTQNPWEVPKRGIFCARGKFCAFSNKF